MYSRSMYTVRKEIKILESHVGMNRNFTDRVSGTYNQPILKKNHNNLLLECNQCFKFLISTCSSNNLLSQIGNAL